MNDSTEFDGRQSLARGVKLPCRVGQRAAADQAGFAQPIDPPVQRYEGARGCGIDAVGDLRGNSDLLDADAKQGRVLTCESPESVGAGGDQIGRGISRKGQGVDHRSQHVERPHP